MIERKQYQDWLIKHKDNGLIKVISGVRRSGKSTLFQLYKGYLLKLGIRGEQIIHINFEDLRYYDLRSFLTLNEYILNLIKGIGNYYIFLDEIQNVEKFQEVVNSLNLQENLDIYITGSNAYFMSGELATLLTGRYIELKILPLSFKEYYSEYTSLDPIEVYERYKKTAFPYLVNKDDLEEHNYYLRSAYNDIALKDIVTRYKITEQNLLERVLRFLVSVIGSEISINKIANTLKSQNVSISNNTVERYIDAFVNGLILYPAPRYDIKGRKLLQRWEKYYVVDLGFRGLLLPDAVGDEGHILENIVFLELKRRYKEVYVGKNENYEVDFVCLDDDNNSYYYQVALETLSEQTLARELRSLEGIKDNYPKYLLTLDRINKAANYNGINKQNVLDWLLE
jgi:predicted AAA+ superfamily ATPase